MWAAQQKMVTALAGWESMSANTLTLIMGYCKLSLWDLGVL